MRSVISVLAVAALVLAGSVAHAEVTPPPPQQQGCDFMTGGGWIIHSGAKGTFGVGGGCKHGSGVTTPEYWGHLEYHDHGTGLNVHWTSITAYFPEGDTTTDPKTHQPLGTRFICGEARTNQFGDVHFVVRARDAGEPGVNDEFDLQLRDSSGAIVYSTPDDGTFPHKLGGGAGGGGNIQLHKPNPSTTGVFGGSCPAL